MLPVLVRVDDGHHLQLSGGQFGSLFLDGHRWSSNSFRIRSAVSGKCVSRAPQAAAAALATAGATLVLVSSPAALAPSGPGPVGSRSSTVRNGGTSIGHGTL